MYANFYPRSKGVTVDWGKTKTFKRRLLFDKFFGKLSDIVKLLVCNLEIFMGKVLVLT